MNVQREVQMDRKTNRHTDRQDPGIKCPCWRLNIVFN